MPPTSRRRARTVDNDALSALSSSKPIERVPDVDPVLGAGAPRVAQPDAESVATPPPAAPITERSAPKVRFGAAIDPAVAEQVRDAVVYLGGDWTVARLLEEALQEKVTRLAKANDQQGGFPSRRSARLRVGRRVS